MQHYWGSCIAATVKPSVEITGRRECGVQRVPLPWSAHPLCDIIDGIVLPPRPPYWQAAMEVSEKNTREQQSKQNETLIDFYQYESYF
jgi:hypothetical protein